MKLFYLFDECPSIRKDTRDMISIKRKTLHICVIRSGRRILSYLLCRVDGTATTLFKQFFLLCGLYWFSSCQWVYCPVIPVKTQYQHSSCKRRVLAQSPETSSISQSKPQRHHSISLAPPRDIMLFHMSHNLNPKDILFHIQIPNTSPYFSESTWKHHPISHSNPIEITLFHTWFLIICVRIKIHL